jgi:pimeloyl-ACP methyl ester carboxylesterase
MKRGLALTLTAVLLLAASGPVHAVSKMRITTETFFVDASDPGIKLHVRNKHMSGKKVFQPDKIVLFVHGASYPSETMFDIALPGGSWMDYAAPLWTLKAPPPFSGSGAYRVTTKAGARSRALNGIPDARKEEINPQAWFDKWWDANLAADPWGARQTPPVVRSPNGVLKDIVDFLGKGTPLYDPSDIRVPTLLIVAEWDQDTPLFMAQEVFSRLINTPYKREVVLAEGTHMLAVEKNRMELIKEVQRFLDEKRPGR